MPPQRVNSRFRSRSEGRVDDLVTGLSSSTVDGDPSRQNYVKRQFPSNREVYPRFSSLQTTGSTASTLDAYHDYASSQGVPEEVKQWDATPQVTPTYPALGHGGELKKGANQPPDRKHSLVSLNHIKLGQLHITSRLNPYTMPEEALTFEPSTGAFMTDTTRHIFLNSPLTWMEQTKLSELKEFLSSSSLHHEATAAQTNKQSGDANRHHSHATDSEFHRSMQAIDWRMYQETEHLRFLYATNFDIKEATNFLWANFLFRLTELPVYESQVAQDLSLGAVYWHGRDKNLRPLLIIKLSKLEHFADDLMRAQRLFIFCFEFFLRYLTIAGRVENWLILVDCENTGLTNFPTAAVQYFLTTLMSKYRGRLFQLVVVNFPRWIGWLSSWILSVVPSASLSKIVFLPTGVEEHLAALFAPHQLERRYGGSSPNMTKDYFPFRFFPGPFEPYTPPEEVRWKLAMRNVHEAVPEHVIVGSSWAISPSILRKRSSRHRQQHNPPSGETMEEAAEDTFKRIAWLKHIYEQSLTQRSAAWLRPNLRIDVKPLTTLDEFFEKYTDRTRSSNSSSTSSNINMAS